MVGGFDGRSGWRGEMVDGLCGQKLWFLGYGRVLRTTAFGVVLGCGAHWSGSVVKNPQTRRVVPERLKSVSGLWRKIPYNMPGFDRVEVLRGVEISVS